MSDPISVDLPHSLGTEEARRRIAANMHGLTAQLPPGADVRSIWEGDRLTLHVAVLGQQVAARIAIEETLIRVTVLLPPALAMFRAAIERRLRKSGFALLDDKSAKKG